MKPNRNNPTGPASSVIVEPDATAQSIDIPAGAASLPSGTRPGAAGVAVDPASERDYWHVHYESRPYYVEGRSFGDYEAAYRYGWESASTMADLTFEEAEKTRLPGGWTAARGKSPFTWEEVRGAVLDAWTRVRRASRA